MKTLPASLCLFAVSLLYAASLSAQNPDEKPLIRNLRFLVIGDYPPPCFEQQNGVWMEVDPPAKQIPPTTIKPILDPDAASSGSNEPPPASSLRFNQIVTMPNFPCPAKLRLSLERISGPGKADQEISCELGKLTDPLVIIFADIHAGWDKPQIRVADFSVAAIPAGGTYVSNLTPFTLAVTIEGTKAVLAPDQEKVMKSAVPVGPPSRFRVDVASDSAVAPLANSSYQLRDSERLVIVAVPNSDIKGRPPVTLRLVTDTIVP